MTLPLELALLLPRAARLLPLLFISRLCSSAIPDTEHVLVTTEGVDFESVGGRDGAARPPRSKFRRRRIGTPTALHESDRHDASPLLFLLCAAALCDSRADCRAAVPAVLLSAVRARLASFYSSPSISGIDAHYVFLPTDSYSATGYDPDQGVNNIPGIGKVSSPPLHELIRSGR